MGKILKRRKNAFILSIFTFVIISVFTLSDELLLLVEAHNLIPYSIDWTDTNLITVDNNWSVSDDLGARGYSGSDTPVTPGQDARTFLTESLVVDVDANETNPDTLVEGGVAEFEIANPTIALKASDTAHAPYINLLIDSRNFTNIRLRCNVRDIDGSANNAVQQVAVQFRIRDDETGPYMDVPSAYIADATQGGTATQITPIDVTLPPLANGHIALEIRIMTVNAVGNDEWIGIDDIMVTGVPAATPTPTPTPTSRRTRFDFDGDGRADISVYRPSDGIWHLLRSQTGFTSFQFGIISDRPVPADFDGDGKTDLAVYRDGTWFIQRSTLGFTAIQFGIIEDIPQPADFDGDGRAEVAVFRPSNGIWYVINLVNNNFTGFQFGSLEDKPVVGDYDGDNRADYAVFRPSNGVWYYQQSTAGFGAIQFGIATDRAVPADYDGDNRTDVAVYRPSNGVWYYQRSTAGFGAIQFGLDTDRPSPADYDGDGRADVAVFRPSNGIWFLQQSTAGFGATQFGISEDKPVPNAFVPLP